MAGEGDRRAGPALGRSSRILGGGSSGGDGRRSVALALASTAVFAVLLALAITHSPGWHEVRTTFFNWGYFKDSFPEIARAFRLNVKIFCIAEAFILVFALLLAVLRSLPGPVFFPLRALAIAYADFFRGVPTILVIALLGFGAPALQVKGVPTSVTFWGIVSLVLVYTAYVSEVYRAGIESVHPSQDLEPAERLPDVLDDERLAHAATPAACLRRRSRRISQSVKRASGIVIATKSSAAAT